MGNYYQKDLYWTELGDFYSSQDGDLLDTNNMPTRSLFQEIRTRITNEGKNWKLYPGLKNASLSDFHGQINNSTTAKLIKEKVQNALKADNLIFGQDLSVQVVPFNNKMLGIRVIINCEGTPDVKEQTLEIQMAYDTIEDNFIPLGN